MPPVERTLRNIIIRFALFACGSALSFVIAPTAWGEDVSDSPQTLADRGRTLLQGYRKDPSHPETLTAALSTFTAAEKAFLSIGKKDEALEASANITWCQRQLDRPDVKAALASSQVPAIPVPPASAPTKSGKESVAPTVFMHRVQPPANAQPMLDEAAWKPVLEQLHTKFSKEYAKHSTEDRRGFAIRLYQEALKNRKDPASFQAIVMESVRLSVESGDLVQTLLSVDRLAGSCSGCDALAIKKEWVQKCSTKNIATTFVLLLDKPQDAVGNLAAGRYTAIELGRWDDALPMMARGTPTPLSLLATRDLASPDDGMDLAVLGED